MKEAWIDKWRFYIGVNDSIVRDFHLKYGKNGLNKGYYCSDCLQCDSELAYFVEEFIREEGLIPNDKSFS